MFLNALTQKATGTQVIVVPWMVCGSNQIGMATAEKMSTVRLVVWAQHGIYNAGAHYCYGE